MNSDHILFLGDKIGVSNIEQILAARDLIINGLENNINLAGVLLFGNKPQKWVERSRIRVIKYEGIKEETSTSLNIIKDLIFDKSLIDQLEDSAKLIESILREFTKLDPNTGKFTTISEYPPFAWKETLVNAIAHREYALTGAGIEVKIFDDRIEIISPGNLPSTVRVDNIKDAHFSRNPKIARVLCDLGYVRELGEGVNRIFEEMNKAGLPEPIFQNPQGSVIVTLKNDIAHRELRKYSDLKNKIPNSIFDKLNNKEQKIVLFVLENSKITKKEVTKLIGMSTGTSIGILNKLQEKNLPILIVKRKSLQDPNAYYILNPDIFVTEINKIPDVDEHNKKVQGNLFWS